MESTKYIGMDVHKDTISIAVMNSAGKLMIESIVETKAMTILQFVQGLRGTLQVTFEEGTWAAWLYDLLEPYVTKVVVCNPRRNALLKTGNKSDRIDARKLAELLRAGLLSAVYHGDRPTNPQGAVTQLSNHQQGSHPRHESAEGAVSKLGHSLHRHSRLRSTPSLGMVEQDNGSRRAPSGPALLPTARHTKGIAPGSATRPVGREPKTERDEMATPDSLQRSDSGCSVDRFDPDA
jgi:Transposase